MTKYEYKYPKADNTATVVLLFDSAARTLVITRGKDPFAGKNAFPGGFLEVGKETLRQAARRELLEETCIELDEHCFLPVDLRSAPDRDPRGHVIDAGFAVIVDDNAAKQHILSQLRAADDAAAAHVVPVDELLRDGMAFDHRDLLVAALELYKRLR